jgi:hypothetical protein
MLILQLRFIRRSQIPLGNQNLRNSLTAVRVEDDPDVYPYRHRFVAQPARLEV